MYKTEEQQRTEEINQSEFILYENGEQEWTINEDSALKEQLAIAHINALNSIGRSLITLNRLIMNGYLQS